MNKPQRKLPVSVVILTDDSLMKEKPLFHNAIQWCEQVIFLHDGEEGNAVLQKISEAEVVLHKLQNDFAQHRNAVFPAVQQPWALFLDMDEEPSEAFWPELQKALESGKEAFFIRRQNRFLGKPLRFGEAGEKWLLRLARTSLGSGAWKRAVHEVWEVPTKKMGSIQALVLHEQPESISLFLQKLNRYSRLELLARSQPGKTRLLAELLIYPVGKFLWNFLFRQGFRDGFPGLALCFLMSYYSATVRVQLYEEFYT